MQLLLGRHGAGDHYLGGRFRSAARAPRRAPALAFPLGPRTVHLFELMAPARRREAVPASRIFPAFSSRYQRSALAFARRVEAAGGRNFNAEARATAEAEQRYLDCFAAAVVSDVAFFKRPTFTRYLALAAAEERFLRLREELIGGNVEHFAAEGDEVVVRLGRIHSRLRRLCRRRGLAVRALIGTGLFYPEQVMKRRALFGFEVRPEDRLRGYVDRLLRQLPLWQADLALPPPRTLLALGGGALAAVAEECAAAVMAAVPSLPEIRPLLAMIAGAGDRRRRPGGAW